jgi:hypothetical protein
MNRKPPGGVIRNAPKAAVGGGALLLAFLLYMLFPFGLGSGSGQGESEGESGGESSSTGDAMVTSRPMTTPGMDALNDPSPLSSFTDDEKRALSDDVLTVLIDEHDYLVELPSDSEPVYRPLALDRIVAVAELATGDANGIRVRVLRRDSARASAEEKLRLELKRAGIESNAIHMSDSTVP